MGNFDFLQKEWPDLAKLANSAEIYLYSDPNSCLIKLGILAEQIVNHIVTANFIDTTDNPTTHSDKISLIKKKGLAPVGIIDILYKLKKVRNEAVHANLESVDEAISMLKYAHTLSFWFNLHYGKYHYIKFEPYVLPDDSLRQELFEEIEAQRRAQCIREELEKFKLEEQKRKFEMEQRRKEYAHQREERIKKEAEQRRREEAQRRHAEEERKRKAEEESLKLAELERMLEILKRREEYLRQKEENERREAEEKLRQREEAERKFQYLLKKTVILNDIKIFYSSLNKEDYFANDYTKISEDIMTFTRNVNNIVYSSIQELTNAHNALINRIKSIKTISQVKAQKRRRNTIVSCLSGIAAVVVFVILLFEIILPTINYNKAVDLLEQNKYEEAGEIFEDLDGFKDSNEQVIVIDNELKYQNAVNLLNNNQLTEAKQIFVELNGFRESNTYIKYVDAMNLLVEHKYTDAQVLFTELNDFRDSKDRLSYANTHIVYEPIYDFLKAGKTKEAIEQAQLLSMQVEYDFDFNGADSVNEVDSYNKQPVKTGYNFVGWGTLNYNLDTEQGRLFLNLKAMWDPRSDIPYKINRYFENIENNNYTLSLTEDLMGIADSIIMPEVNTYPGFTSPTIQTAKVNADGSLVIEYYYTRNYYEINFITNGGENITPLRQKYQAVNKLPTPVRENYTFGGWYGDKEQREKFDLSTPSNNMDVYAYWLEENKAHDFIYEGENGITINDYVGTSEIVAIPSYIGGVAVTNIKSCAFEDAFTITKVIVPDTVVEIGKGAFTGCNAIEDITLPFTGARAKETRVSQTTVFGYIFGEDSYNGATATEQIYGGGKWIIYFIPNSLKTVTITQGEILDLSFNWCGNLTNVILCDGVISVGDAAFSYCRELTHITIPNSVAKIGDTVFSGCENLTNVQMSEKLEQIDAYVFDDCSKLKRTIKNKIKYLECNGNPYFIAYDWYSEYTNMTLSIENGCKYISIDAFKEHPTVATTIIPNSVVSIGDYAFGYCEKLKNVTIGSSVTYIGSHAFSGTSMSKIEMPDSVTRIGDYAFYSYYRQEIRVSNAIISVGEHAFSTNVKSYNAKANIRYVGNEYNPYLVAIGMVHDDESEISISNRCKIIAKKAFCYKRIKKVHIPITVNVINENAFYECINIEDIYYYGTSKQWGDILIENGNSALKNAKISYEYQTQKE